MSPFTTTLVLLVLVLEKTTTAPVASQSKSWNTAHSEREDNHLRAINTDIQQPTEATLADNVANALGNVIVTPIQMTTNTATKLVTGVTNTLVSLPHTLGLTDKTGDVDDVPETAATYSESPLPLDLTSVTSRLDEDNLKSLNTWWCGHSLLHRLNLIKLLRQHLQHCPPSEQAQCRRTFRHRVRTISKCPQED